MNKDPKKLSEMVDIREIEGSEKQNYPRKVDTLITTKKAWYNKYIFTPLLWIVTLGMYKPKGKKVINAKLVQPLLLLLKDDGYIDVIEGVKPGLFVVNIKGTDKQKGIFLGANKLRTLNMEPYPKVWTAYENEMSPYPLDVYHDAEEALAIIRKIATNRDLLKDQAKLMTAKMWFWVAIIGVCLVGVYFAIQQGWFDKIITSFRGGK